MVKITSLIILGLVAFFAFWLPRNIKNLKNKNFLKKIVAYLDEGIENQRAYIADNVSHQIRKIALKSAVDFSRTKVRVPEGFILVKSYALSAQELLLITQYNYVEASGVTEGATVSHFMPLSYLLKFDPTEQSLHIIGEYPNSLVEKNANSTFAEHISKLSESGFTGF